MGEYKYVAYMTSMLYVLFFIPIFTKGVVVLDYIIRNKSGLYVKLNENGTPETCNESQRGLFECSKANNICNSLPKQLKKFNFFVEAVPEIQSKIEKQNVITTNTYVPSENVTRWINEFGQCEDVLDKARKRYEVLNVELSEVDLKLQDILHNIEFSEKCDMFTAWKFVNEIRFNRKKRRNIKDEKLVLSGIKTQGITYLNRKSVQKRVDGLSKRKYKLRIVEEDEYDDLQNL